MSAAESSIADQLIIAHDAQQGAMNVILKRLMELEREIKNGDGAQVQALAERADRQDAKLASLEERVEGMVRAKQRAAATGTATTDYYFDYSTTTTTNKPTAPLRRQPMSRSKRGWQTTARSSRPSPSI